MYGGAAGGGKTWSLLLDPLRYMDVEGFGGVIFRRKFTEVTNEGGLWDESMQIYPLDGARPVGHQWRWPNGNKITFAHLVHEETKLAYQGSQMAFIGFDELTHFSESQFWYLLSRNRSLCGVRPYVRATCNADSDSWVARLISWYWDQRTGLAIPERGGVVRYFIRFNDDISWGDTKQELEERHEDWLSEQRIHAPDMDPIKSFTFIPAKVTDNKILLQKDPGYLANLHAQLPVERERLLNGNWKISPSAGDIFDRNWFRIVDKTPKGGFAIRFFDLAATLPKQEDKGHGPSYSAGVLIRKVDGLYYVEDMINVRLGPADVDTLLIETARDDLEWAKAADCAYAIRWEREPGSAGKREAYRLRSTLAEMGIDGNGVPPQGDKIQRAVPAAITAKAGKWRVVEGDWNDEYLTHLHNQPDYAHKDIMDANSGAYLELTRTGTYKPVRQ